MHPWARLLPKANLRRLRPGQLRRAGKAIGIVVFLTASFFAAGCERETSLEPTDLTPAQRKEADRILGLFQEFQANLQQELGGAIAAGGLPAAIDRCKLVSPQLGAEMSTASLKLRRISDRPRNPRHVPDDFEQSVLEQWTAQLADNSELQPLVAIHAGDLRVMRPIRIQKTLCLNCHGGRGEEISPETLAAIEAQYPQDQATGYELGDLRGAFSAQLKP